MKGQMKLKSITKWVDNRYGAIKQVYNNNLAFDNVNRVARILYRMNAYRKLSFHMWRRGITYRDIIRTQFPLINPEPAKPAQVTLEFTNHCNLRCVYCTSSLALRPQGFMSDETFRNTLEGIKQLHVDRVRIVGNGEPTLHPDFSTFTQTLCEHIPFVSIITNAQWREPENVIKILLESSVSLVEISVDGGYKDTYEKMRVGGKFERLIDNLKLLKAAKKRLGASTMINLRLMMRPSDRFEEKKLTAFWKQYGDSVMPQYIVTRKQLDFDDAFTPTQREEHSYPKCSVPFKSFDVIWNGNVPLCNLSIHQLGGEGLVLGNVNEINLKELWNSLYMKQYRQAHYKRNFDKMPICKGCTGI